MKPKQLLFILVIIVIAGGVGYWMGHSGSKSGAAGDSSSMNMDAPSKDQKADKGRKVLYWKAPMNPSEIYDHPGKSKMGMDLVPVYADEQQASTEGTVKINPIVQQDMGVRTAPVEMTDFSTTVRTVGTVNYDEERLYTVTTKISGWINKLYIDYTGQMVHKGDPMLDIYSPELVTTQQEYLLALNTRDMLDNSTFSDVKNGGQSLLASTRKRLEYWDIPAAEIRHLEQTKEVRKNLTLTAPATGVVIKKNAVDGDYIKDGMNVYQIADLSKVWVEASIYDNEIPWIRKGQPAEMELSYLPGKIFKGRVSYIYPYLNDKARDVRVRMVFDNPDGILKPGMYANIKLQGRMIRNTVVIPSEAVIHSGERTLVFVSLGNGTFQPQEVRLGKIGGSDNSQVQVLDGLKPGQEVVTSAQFLLDSESRLQSAIQKMLKQKKPDSMAGMKMKKDSAATSSKMNQSGMKIDDNKASMNHKHVD